MRGSRWAGTGSARGWARAASARPRGARRAAGATGRGQGDPRRRAGFERAQREARAVARLDHDAIVALFDAGEEDGRRYLVSELVEGRTLAQLEAAGELSDRDVLRIGWRWPTRSPTPTSGA